MFNVLIVGAGSIGNHHAEAWRRYGANVSVHDRDPEALRRMKEEIYPKRYGAWDEEIQFIHPKQTKDLDRKWDVVVIGTPPNHHLSVAEMFFGFQHAPGVTLIEKPLCSPHAFEIELNVFRDAVSRRRVYPWQHPVLVGFNHLVSKQTKAIEDMMAVESSSLGRLLSMDTEVRSEWGGILAAHPWLSGPHETYLGDWRTGGGAGGEHIHALNLWQHFARLTGSGEVTHVQGMMSYVVSHGKSYDSICMINLKTENGLVGRVVQDVVTSPKRKIATLQFENGQIIWHNDFTKTSDKVEFHRAGREAEIVMFQKERRDEFYEEVLHIAGILKEEIKVDESPLLLRYGIESMRILAEAHYSHSRMLPRG